MTGNLGKTFKKLKYNNPLVDKLVAEEWWSNLVKLSHTDPDINIQIRSNSINVYSKMGNLLRISLNKGQIICEVHYKYLISSLSSPYIKISPESGLLKVGKDACPSVKDILSKNSLKVIKQNIATYAGEEKTIQSKLVEKNKQTLLDVEVAFSGETPTESEDRNDARIDLVNFDKKHKKMVFIELKQIFDKRLYCNEINEQIEKYYKFANANSQQIMDAYNDCLQTKKKLGIINETSLLDKIIINELEPKPILAVAAYNQNVIDALKDTILKRLNTTYLAGIYFFGTDVDLNFSKGKNKTLFL